MVPDWGPEAEQARIHDTYFNVAVELSNVPQKLNKYVDLISPKAPPAKKWLRHAIFAAWRVAKPSKIQHWKKSRGNPQTSRTQHEMQRSALLRCAEMHCESSRRAAWTDTLKQSSEFETVLGFIQKITSQNSCLERC